MTVSKAIALGFVLAVLGVLLFDEVAYVLAVPRGAAIIVCTVYGLGLGWLIAGRVIR